MSTALTEMQREIEPEIHAEIEYSAYSEFDPKEYIAEYYSEVIPDCRYAMEWLIESMEKVPSVSVALEFGTGPIPAFTFPLATKAREIHLAEYLPANRAEIQRWVQGSDDAQDWLNFSLEMLRLQGNLEPTVAQARACEQQARRRIRRVLPGDAGELNPLGLDRREFYPLVATHCCAEGITTNKEDWRVYMRNILSLVQPGGVLIETAVEAASYYHVGARRFPCAGVTRYDLLEALEENGFTDIDLRVRQTPDNSEQGFSSIILARAIKGK